ncbi:alpha/beta hydrolase [Parvibium lacunae]|uniref:Alpha/beta hydrolase n=1 Tax=Parvibium lacunae TaxID=1888893 RepID=A0A368KYL2_9BURK|nr:alpha/beta hydrolase [Parvibium lacunae]RCS56517.1 alpha/beta hydrolase [Parvibium lacunae]
MTPLDFITIETGPNPQALVIWMHGLGADGNDFVPIVDELNLDGCPDIRFIFPHAPMIPVTINGGYVMRAWYDILSSDLVRREDEAGLRTSQLQIETLLAQQAALGIPAERTILAGFSQGGAMTLQVGLRYAERLAGLIVLSAYAPLIDVLPRELQSVQTQTPIFMAHGTEDPIVPYTRGQATRDALQALHCQVEWHEYPMPHSVCWQEISAIGQFLKKVLIPN